MSNGETLTRIYIVRDNLINTEVLVRAADRHKALRWAVQQRFEVSLATQDALEEMLTSGMRVQRAADDTEPELVDPPLFEDEPLA